jgi:hypothetical protein
MVAYFRAFTPSEDLPRGTDDVYLDLALSQKGVCRHRAFAFLVTALGLGIPARMVVNEAHAWVEVQGERSWQRIDLGGAAGAIEEKVSDARPAYQPPAEPFEWPASAETGSGHAAAERGRQTGPASPGAPGTRTAAAPASESDDVSAPFSTAQRPPGPTSSRTTSREPGSEGQRAGPGDERPRPRLVVRGDDVHVHRGEPIRVSGSVEVDGVGCGQLRVDVFLRKAERDEKENIGSLTTDANGAFDGNIFLPLGFPVGDYDLNVATPGDARCGPGTSR